MSRILSFALGAAIVGGAVAGLMLHMPSPRAQELDLDAIFRCFAEDEAGKQSCAEARELTLFHCTACHTFTPIVMVQFDRAGWEGLFARHIQESRVDQLEPEQVDKIREYVTANFNPEHEPPELPPFLLKTWTAY